MNAAVCHSGLFLHTRGITGKRERESEREGSGEKDPAACSLNKMQRQSAEVRGQHIQTVTITDSPLNNLQPPETRSSFHSTASQQHSHNHSRREKYN